MATHLLRPTALVRDDQLVEGEGVLIEAGRITAVGAGLVGDTEEQLEGTLLPGAIDLQVNGAGGRSVEEASAVALETVAETVRAGGATAFLPTLITAPFDSLLEQVSAVAAWCQDYDGPGARPLGMHVEGPFLEVPGAHDAQHFVDPSPERVVALLEAAAGTLRLVTLAPARAGAVEATARLKDAGVCVSIGHASSTTNFGACVEAGADLATHLFNTMGGLHHRDDGVAARSLDEVRLSACLIADGHHVGDSMLRNAWRILGPERAVLVTDSVAAAAQPDGEYLLGGLKVRKSGGTVRTPEGALAGSTLVMRDAVDHAQRVIPELSPSDLARLTAGNPARLLADSSRGAIAPGMRAEFSLLTSSGLEAL
ncbi:MAG: amidohydrolase family protein [Planctomycetes bacterium]|nr:amidohydrolase family protein [Planctomycetota bacterium]